VKEMNVKDGGPVFMVLLDAFYDEWFDNQRWWFSATASDDAYIADKYGSLLFEDYQKSVINNSVVPLRRRIALIVMYDQLPRHVGRHQQTLQNEAIISDEQDHSINTYLERALTFADTITDEDLSHMTSPEICFALLPYRHTQDPSLIFKAATKAWDLLERKTDDDKYLKKFIKASYQRCPMSQDKLVQIFAPEHVVNDEDNDQDKWHTTTTNLVHKYRDIVHESCTTTTTNNINYEKHILKQSMDIDNRCPIVTRVANMVSSYPLTKVVISLSGGVDSMILSYVLSRLMSLDQKYSTGPSMEELVAVHIDYANRETSRDEARFVRDWCSEALGISVVTRRIDEIARDRCMRHGLRSTYEDYTRRVRFGTYRAAAFVSSDNKPCGKNTRQNNSDKNNKNNDNIQNIHGPDCIVFLGHNLDDSFENILTNVTHKTKYDNLKGMREVQDIDGITFCRPLLGVAKADIYKFAADHGIPHLYDSTASWSQRGQIRDALVPALNTWNRGAIPGFFSLSESMSELHEVLDALVDEYVAKTREKGGTLELTMSTISTKLLLNKIFWRTYIHRLFGLHVSCASLDCFVSRLARIKKNQGPKQQNRKTPSPIQKCVLTKSLAVVIVVQGDVHKFIWDLESIC
jgi:tRNA(Ile)-lysidine synthase TilS/MesJ/uncharacterized protein (DUF924 family)